MLTTNWSPPNRLPNNSEAVQQYLRDAFSTEQAFEQRLRSFANEGDDEEVQLIFAEQANDASLVCGRLKSRLRAISEDESAGINFFRDLPGFVEQFGQSGHIPEELVLRNLICASSLAKGLCATYEALANAAASAGDPETHTLARDIQASHERAAEKSFRFLSTRSKIAFNVLTAGEIDPSIETHASENRIT